MKSIRRIILCGLVLGASVGFADAQTISGTNFSAEDTATLLEALELATPTPVASLPQTATWWSAQHAPGLPGAWPPLPSNGLGLDAWPIGDGNFVLNDTNVDYDAVAADAEAARTRLSGGRFHADDMGGGGMSMDALSIADYGTNLWIAQWSVVSNTATGIASNTLADVQYEISAVTNLMDTNWVSQGFFTGSETTNWTPLNAMSASLTNNFFIRLRSWESSDGSGLPDWWELQYFGHTGVDPYADPMGDGWNNYQKFLNGWNPLVFYQPPVPQGVTTLYNTSNGIVALSWLPSPGAVTGYTVTDSDGHTFTLAASVTSVSDDISGDLPDPANNGNPDTALQLTANYGTNGSATTGQFSVLTNPITGFIVAGAQGNGYLTVSGLPNGTSAIRIQEIDESSYSSGPVTMTNFDIPITAFTNGVSVIPNSLIIDQGDAFPGGQPFVWYGQAVGTNGQGLTATTDLSQSFSGPYDDFIGQWLVTPFCDGRRQLKENLIFQLRAALTDRPFQYQENYPGETYQDFFTAPPDYAYAGFYSFIAENGQAEQFFDPFLPFEENYFDENFVFTAANLDPYGFLSTGIFTGNNGSGLNNWIMNGIHVTINCPWEAPTLAYLFQAPTVLTNGLTIGDVLATNDTRWLASFPFDSSSEIGITNDVFASNARNLYGLPLLSLEMASNGPTAITLSPGSYVAPNQYAYVETEQPQLQLQGYNFWNTSPLPGSGSFEPTNSSDTMIVEVGGSIQVNGYAKYSVQNAYSGVYGYLQQYFAQAYQVDTYSNVTSNTTGILSPFGQFFATQPGPVALVTMPDIDTGAQGTNIVHCISLNVDKNHDGTMDLSFNGPDTTSQTSPMEFWVNNDNDGTGVGADIVAPNLPDSSNDVIQSMRDLEDFARLWICGVPSGAVLDNYQVSMSFQNCTGNPSIKLFNSDDPTGSYGYLTNTTIASEYVGNVMNFSSLGTISSGATYIFPFRRFYGGGTNCFLFEGVTAGKGQLVLTITDSNSNIVAQTGVWLDLHDVKDFLEQAVITNNASGAMSNWTSAVESVLPAVSSGLGNDTNLIVLVHGINVQPWDCLTDAETVYKRLYWAGYQGQFCDVKWPCNLLTPFPSPLTPAVFNLSEFQGYIASQAMAIYIANLRSRFPGYRLNLLVHSQGNSVMSEAIKNGVPFDTYILTQGALPESCYDANAPTNAAIASNESGTRITPDLQPMGYKGIYTNLTGRIVNFYNPVDPVLAIWITDQELEKPSFYLDTANYRFDGTNSYYHSVGEDIYLVTDPEESRAMVARSRTLSIGQSGPTTSHGVIQSAVNLNAQFGFNDDFPGDHSAQWVWPIHTTRPYFQQVLRSCQIIPAP